jgi:hypothetical protein
MLFLMKAENSFHLHWILRHFYTELRSINVSYIQHFRKNKDVCEIFEKFEILPIFSRLKQPRP